MRLASLKGHTKPVTSAEWSPDGTRVVTGSVDETVRVWDAHTCFDRGKSLSFSRRIPLLTRFRVVEGAGSRLRASRQGTIAHWAAPGKAVEPAGSGASIPLSRNAAIRQRLLCIALSSRHSDTAAGPP